MALNGSGRLGNEQNGVSCYCSPTALAASLFWPNPLSDSGRYHSGVWKMPENNRSVESKVTDDDTWTVAISLFAIGRVDIKISLPLRVS